MRIPEQSRFSAPTGAHPDCVGVAQSQTEIVNVTERNPQFQIEVSPFEEEPVRCSFGIKVNECAISRDCADDADWIQTDVQFMDFGDVSNECIYNEQR